MDIVEYKKNNLKDMHLARIWLITMIFIIVLVIILFNSFKYKRYYQNTGILIDKNNIVLSIYNEDLNKILEHKKLIINKESFAYKVMEINSNTNYYKDILLNVNLKDEINIKNNEVNIKILLEEETILKYILKKIGGKR